MKRLESIAWQKTWPFIVIHILPFGIFFTQWNWTDVFVCIALYYIRMFFITAGYHRYFAHRSYQMNRWVQFLMAFGGTTAAQKGVLWWASHHRHHHHYSDLPQDVHSPLRGFWWSHIGWILCDTYDQPRLNLVKDLVKYPELVFLNKHYLLPPTLLAIGCYLAGGTSMLFVGFFLSTVLLYHGTFAINSLTHLFGKRRYVTNDSSRNSFLLALITCGEGWHNNHHYFPASVKQGFFWWEIDLSYYLLKVCKWLGLVRNFQLPTVSILKGKLIRKGNFDTGLFNVTWQKVVALLPNKSMDKAMLYVLAKQKALESWIQKGQLSAKEFKVLIQQVVMTA